MSLASDARMPRIMGIVNITQDSFSDGGLFLDPSAAIAHASSLLANGADIVDLGPASSNPDAVVVTAEEEIRRLDPVIAALQELSAEISVDSFLPETQRYAMSRGVSYLNDIQGFPDPVAYPDLAAATCSLIVMHSVQGGGPATRTVVPEHQIWDRILRFFEKRIAALEHAGIDRRRLIVDPGMGFFLSSRAKASLQVLANLGRLRDAFELPVLVSVSRKSFLRAVTGREISHIGAGTLAAELWSAMHGADIIRTHDVAALKDGLTVLNAIADP
jgi:dihydropteroate synthase type 2